MICAVRTHQAIDQRSLALARAIVEQVDADPCRRGLQKAVETCARWVRENPSDAAVEWTAILRKNWADIRAILLEASEEARRLRQSSPFCGVLSPRKRWDIYRRFSHESKAA
jgi:hypothetical protein